MERKPNRNVLPSWDKSWNQWSCPCCSTWKLKSENSCSQCGHVQNGSELKCRVGIGRERLKEVLAEIKRKPGYPEMLARLAKH